MLTLSAVEENTGGHWLAIDAKGAFASATLKIYKRASSGVTPTLIYGDGAPLVIGDGSLEGAGAEDRRRSRPNDSGGVLYASAFTAGKTLNSMKPSPGLRLSPQSILKTPV